MSKSIKLVLFTAVVCYSLSQVRSFVCEALCHKEEYDRGYYDEKKKVCVCGAEKSFVDFTNVLKILPAVEHESPTSFH